MVKNIFSTILGKPSKSYSSSDSASGFAALPDFAQSAWEKLISGAQDTSGNLDTFKNAPLNPLQTQGAATIGTPYESLSPEKFSEGISMFTNPYTDEVIGNTEKDLHRFGSGLFNDLGSGATEAGGFGGTRQAVGEGEISRSLLDELAKTSAGLRSTGYENAANKVLSRFDTDFANQQGQAVNQFNTGSAIQSQDTQNQQAPASALSWLQQILTGLQSSTGSSGGTSTGGQPGLLSQLANFIPGGNKTTV